MRANAQPIGDNPVLMICADMCVEGAFGDRDMVLVALDCGIGFESADWRISLGCAWIGRLELALDCYCIGNGSKMMPS